jgi:DNA polymerase-3 subunit alpha
MNTHGEDKTAPGKTASWIMTDEEVHYWMDKHFIPPEVTQEAIENTARIAERCKVTIEGQDHLPSLTGTDQGDLDLYLSNIQKGLQERIIDKGIDPAEYLKRIAEENSLIISKGFYKYLNIVADYCHWAKFEAKMLVGPGRGSGPGSVVGYMLRITEVDPVKYPELMFSRFLDEGRVGNPDYDLDFPQSRRPEVIKYLVSKYGEEFVSAIGTFSRSGPKQILKDLCRSMGVPFNDAAAMTKIIAQVKGLSHSDDEDGEEEIISLDEIIAKKGGDLAPWSKKYPDLFSKLGDMIGMVRQSGVHASGILISDVALPGAMPVRIKGKNDMQVTQFENSETAGDTEVLDLGWEKFDILGLRHLDTLEEARQLIQKRHGVWLDYYEWTDEQYTDPKIWEAVNKGETLGLFQIETSGAAQIAARFNIKNERDMADLQSVNRPGVIDAGMLEPFLQRKAGQKPVVTPHKLMDEFLKRTYGVVVYQEQIIRLVQLVANFTPSEADGLRKAVGKKLKDKMDQIKPKFIKGCCDNAEFVRLLKRGERAEVVAQKVWDNIEPAARYSFNNAHAQSYALPTCWEAWLKYYYPQEYLTALLRTDPKKVPAYIGWLKKNGIAILPPDINDSEDTFTLSDEGVRYGITSIKNVGSNTYKEIKNKGPFSSFEDLLARVSTSSVDARVGSSLISIGAMDRWGKREVLMAKFITHRKIKGKEIPDFYNDDVVGKIERELTGSYITKDPTDKFSAIIEKECLQEVDQMMALEVKDQAIVGGLVTLVKTHTTKKGDPMAWVTIDWRGEMFELVMFPESYKRNKFFLAEDTPVLCEIERLNKGAQITQLLRLDRM